MARNIETRLRRLERALPQPVVVLLDDGTTAILPRRTDIRLFVGVIAEGRTGQTPALVAEYADVIDRTAWWQRDGTLMPLIRVLREGFQAQRAEQPTI